ncbi:mechanosensitive ion channel family protein [Natronomonas sp.]|uniref:mechanosensitive ion channel family protein n=1 Tax=Natronomonas sp. TaxID=2184060 RepID=UPI003FA542B8
MGMSGFWAVLQAGTPTPTEAAEPLVRPPWLPDYVPMFGYRLVLAVALVVGSYYFSQLLRQILGRRIARRFKRPSVTRTILRGMQTFIVLSAIMVALSFFGLGFGNLALSVGVFSAVVGIVLAPIIGNILSGVFVLSEQPYEIGDMVEIKDTETKGFVEDITLLYTKVFTLDNTFMVMPNGAMRDRDIVNYSAEDTRIRLTLDVGVTYESDIGTARKQMEAAARHTEGVLKGGPDIRIGSARYPASPTCYVNQFGDSEVLLRLRYWAHEPYKQTAVRSRVMSHVWERFEEHDIEIPYPHSHLVFDDTSGEMQVAMREAAEGPATQQSGATRRDEPENAEGEEGGESSADTETEDDADATGSQ